MRLRRLVAVCLALAGCGTAVVPVDAARVPVDGAGVDASDASCADGGVEQCDAIDDDCDGRIDEGCLCSPHVIGAIDRAASAEPMLVATRDGLAVADGTRITRVDFDLVPSGASIEVATTAAAMADSTGELGIVVSMNGAEASFVHFDDRSAGPTTAPLSLGAIGAPFLDAASNGGFALGYGTRVERRALDGGLGASGTSRMSVESLETSGDLAAVLEHDAANVLTLERFDANMTPLDAAPIVLGPASTRFGLPPVVVGDATGWVIGWADGAGPTSYFRLATVTPSETTPSVVDVGNVQSITSAEFLSVALAPDGSIGMAFFEGAVGRVHFARFDRGLRRLGPDATFVAHSSGRRVLAYDVVHGRFVLLVDPGTLYDPCATP